MEALKQTLLIYSSRYGSVKQYAQWILEQRECDMLPANEAKLTALRPYQNLIWMASVHEGKIDGIETLRKFYGKLKEKRVAVLAIGMAPDESELKLPGELDAIPLYYARGRWDPSEFTGKDQMMVKMLKMFTTKKPEAVSSWMNELLNSEEKCDFMDPVYLEAVLDFIDGRD